MIYQDNIIGQDANLDCASLHPGVKWVSDLGDRQFSVPCVAVITVGTMTFCPVLVKCKAPLKAKISSKERYVK